MRFTTSILVLQLAAVGNLSASRAERPFVRHFTQPNDFHLNPPPRAFSNIDRETFDGIIAKIASFFAKPAERYGARIWIDNLWDDDTVNAYASQDPADNWWVVGLYGGLARRPEITPDAFALVVCHEFGHHFAGYPFYGESWATSEGASDYFSAQSCIRKVWWDERDENAKYRDQAPASVKDRCDEAWSRENDRDICYRTMVAGMSMATLLAAVRETPVPEFDTPSERLVEETIAAHPGPQCRLDTIVQASLCTKPDVLRFIPGLRHPMGQNSPHSEVLAGELSCFRYQNRPFGLRPRCWFAPRIKLEIHQPTMKFHEALGNGNGVIEPGEDWQLSLPMKSWFELQRRSGRMLVESATPGVSVDRSPFSYPDIPYFSIKEPERPLAMQVSDQLECGSKIDLKAVIHHEGGGVDLDSLSFRTGVIRQVSTAAARPFAVIPDDDVWGTESTITIDDDTPIKIVRVTVRINHAFMSDVQVDLTTPEGDEYRLWDNEDYDSEEFDEQFEVDIAEATAGDWVLTVRDVVEEDAGRFISWQIETFSATCQGS